jgi:hypothetical protein
LPKQLSVATSSGKLEFITVYPVDQQPIRLDMTVSISSPVPAQDVISIFLPQWLLRSKCPDNRLKPRYIGALPAQSFDITPKSCGLSNPERHELASPIGK